MTLPAVLASPAEFISHDPMSEGQIELVLPDGTRVRVSDGTTSLAVAREIGPGLAKAALAAQFKDQLPDWLTGTPNYWWFSDTAIEDHAVSELTLTP